MTKVVCFIPSITETLIDCGVEVVGRTRFCIHPTEKVNDISIVGGTKDVKWEKVVELSPDLVILDKEENTLEMAENCPLPIFVLHITCINSIADELERLGSYINNQSLTKTANRWKIVSTLPDKPLSSIHDLPGILEVLNGDSESIFQPNAPLGHQVDKIEYMIWKNPWMAIGPNTFIWSVLVKLGLQPYLTERNDKYPNLGEELLADSNCFYLFSSEPYPFQKCSKQLADNGFIGAIVDGECFSWYGTRSLEFLEQNLL